MALKRSTNPKVNKRINTLTIRISSWSHIFIYAHSKEEKQEVEASLGREAVPREGEHCDEGLREVDDWRGHPADRQDDAPHALGVWRDHPDGHRGAEARPW